MSSIRLTDGRVLHVTGAPLVLDSHSVIMAPADDALAELVPLIPADDLLLFAGRLVRVRGSGAGIHATPK